MLQEVKLVLLGFVARAGCPSAWLSLAWRGWRTSLCLRKARRDTLRKLPEELQWQQIGSGDQSWNPAQFLGRDAGRGACGWAAQLISGIVGFLAERRFLVGIGEASWHLRWTEPTCEQPWSQAAFEELFLPLIYAPFVLFGPYCLTWIQ